MPKYVYQKITCPKCYGEIASNAFNKHTDACSGIDKRQKSNIYKKSDFGLYICPECSKQFKSQLAVGQHRRLHKGNQPVKLGTPPWNKGKNKTTDSRVLQIVTKNIGRHQKGNIWSDAAKMRHSLAMKHPNSYNATNVNGRTQSFKVVDSFGVTTRLSGKWELLVSQELNRLGVKWSSVKSGFEYMWNNSSHTYFPDFYLSEYNVYIEVKGYQRERDLCKWKYFPYKLLILKMNEISSIRKGTFNILEKIL